MLRRSSANLFARIIAFYSSTGYDKSFGLWWGVAKW